MSSASDKYYLYPVLLPLNLKYQLPDLSPYRTGGISKIQNHHYNRPNRTIICYTQKTETQAEIPHIKLLLCSQREILFKLISQKEQKHPFHAVSF